MVSTQRFRHPGPAVQPSSVRPPGVQRVQRPARPVSGRPVATPPVSSRLLSAPSVRTRPSRPTSGGGGGNQVAAAGNLHHRMAGNLHHRNGRVPVSCHAVERLGRRPSRPGRGRRCRGRALVSGVAGHPDRGVGGRRRRRLTAERPGRPGRRAERRRRRLRCGHGAGCSARWPQRSRGCRPRAGWATTVSGGRGACRPGGRGPEGPVGVPAGWACGPSAAQAGSGRSRLAADSAVTCWNGWWACQDLNLGPHPYQGCALTA
jgi:hypothetical protein